MLVPEDNSSLTDLGVNSERDCGTIAEIDVNNPLIFTASSELSSVPITQLGNLDDNIILPQNSPIYEPIVDISADPSVDPVTGEAIVQVINSAVVESLQSLRGFAANPEFEAKMDLAFGKNWDKEANISWPAIRVISSAEIDGANGAFAEATQTIYLSQEFLAQNLENIGEVRNVWLEEFGHSIDSQINIVDAQGDEGKIFSAVVQGKDLDEVDIEVLKGENDRAFVEIDGETLEIEKDNYQWVSYRIQPGDSLSQIALNTTGNANNYWKIANKNGIVNPNQIRAGYEIWVPSNNSTGANVAVGTGNNDDWEPYRVQPGDSLWAIAQNTTGDPYRYPDIARYNNLDLNAVLPSGVQIWVPSNNSTGTTQQQSEPTGGSSEPSYTSGERSIRLIESFSEPHSASVDKENKDRTVRTEYPDSYDITIDRTDVQDYILNNLDTWIVIHGWQNSAGNSNELAAAIHRNDNSKQVLTIDWSGMANTGNLHLHDAAIWIKPVAKTIAKQLNEWGFDGNQINVVGHSLGAYVAYEISKEFASYPRSLQGIKNLVALDPAVSTDDGYSIDEVDLSKYSQWSWSFNSSQLGSDDIGLTADESFKVDFPWSWSNLHNDIIEAHGAVKDIWEYMLENPNGEVNQYFGLKNINGNEKPWLIGGPNDWEARIEVESEDSSWVVKSMSYWV